MKASIRILTLLLLVALLGPLLASCGGDGGATTPAGTTAPSAEGTTAAPTVDKWEDVDLSDVTLRVAYNEFVNSEIVAAGATNSLPYLVGPDDEALLSRGDYAAAYERHNRTCDKLGLTLGENLVYSEIGWDGPNTNTILASIQALNTANAEDAPHIVIHQNYGMVRAAILGELYNCKDQSQKNYFDFTDDGWYTDMMLENTLDEDKIYMLMGDYFIDQFRYAFGVLVNADIADEVLSVQGGIEYIYDLVRDGYWTYDTFMEIAEYAYVGGTDSLVMGAVGGFYWVSRCMFATSGLDVFTKNENGEPVYIEGSGIDPVHDWIDRLIAMEKEEFFSSDWKNDSRNTAGAAIATTFIDGRAFFGMNQMVLAMEGAAIQNMDDATGILPFPIYEEDPRGEDATYGALVSDNANCGGVLISADPEMFTAASAFIQLMTEDSDEFFSQYFENGLKYKNNDIGTGHIEMLDIIHDGICSPMSMLYENYCASAVELDAYFTVMNNSIYSGTNTFSSSWDSGVGAKISKWQEIKESFGNRTLQ